MFKPLPICDHSEQFLDLLNKSPDGPIGEFGVFEGGSTIILAKSKRHVFAFDTFEGMPKDTAYDPIIDYHNPPGKFAPSLNVIQLLNKYSNITCIKGTFQKTLPIFDPNVKFAFVYLDCDWYSSYKFVINWLKNRMLPKAIVLVDDYHACSGCKKAIEELTNNGIISFNKITNILSWTKKHYL